jgi:hypothetical protein
MSPDYDNRMESVWDPIGVFTLYDHSFSLFMLELIPTQLQFEQSPDSESKVKKWSFYMWHPAVL